MLYNDKNKFISYSDFMNPAACYRDTPFWAWNGLITREMIDEQIACFKEMGMGGFHIHVRTGLKNQYMDEDFLELVSYCSQKAKEAGMLCWLYDEDRYSSGVAGGEVTKKAAYRARKLRLTPEWIPELSASPEEFEQAEKENRRAAGCLRCIYDIQMEDGYLKNVRIIKPKEADDFAFEGQCWYLYEEAAKESPWTNNQTYVDTLNPKATEYFIALTHEKYASCLGGEFGMSVPAIFTDEPHFPGVKTSAFAESAEELYLPFTEKLPDEFEKRSGEDFYQAVPDIFWNRKEGKFPKSRYYFFETAAEMFVSGYLKPIGDWCQEHGIMATGHILGEESLNSQSRVVGEAMRCYRELQLPGIDNLCDTRDFTAAKQVSSVAHQYGREGALSELYGVTQWDCRFEDYKLAGDWQAALGITVRVPHLAWASMEGEAKRDYPAAIGWQSPWYRYYPIIADHFARLNLCLTRGVPVIHIGVIHPIETMWLCQGPNDQDAAAREELEEVFQNVTEWLLTSGYDFDFISESLLEEQQGYAEDGNLHCGKMKYEVILVPSCKTLRKNTFLCLQKMQEQGGTVIFCGELPEFIGGSKPEDSDKVFSESISIPVSRNRLLKELRPWQEVEILSESGNLSEFYLTRLRKEETCQWLFLAQAWKGSQARQTNPWNRRKLHSAENLIIRIRGEWSVVLMDTAGGKVRKLHAEYEGGTTRIRVSVFGNDSLLFWLIEPGKEVQLLEGFSMDETVRSQKEEPMIPFMSQPVSYELTEPNVLLLDRMEACLDEDSEFMPCCELLRLDNAIRKRLGWKLRGELMEQPYISKEKDVREHTLLLRCTVRSETELRGCQLALEEPEFASVFWNGEPVDMEPVGFYVDKAIRTVSIPTIKIGENELLIRLRYGKKTNLEWMYILGDFGVKVCGREAALTAKPEQVVWGNLTQQGFPFYTGNIRYRIEIDSRYLIKIEQEHSIKIEEQYKDKVHIRIPYYAGTAVMVSANGQKEQTAAFLPYEAVFAPVSEGINTVTITCLGNRYNGFGQLHMIGDDLMWIGPNSWRTEGESWTEEYRLKPFGVLSEPLLWIES